MLKAGEKLKETRLEKGLSLEDVSKQTKIKETFLEHIEEGEYSKLPSVSYAQGFVRNYAEFLGLDEEETMALFRREFDEEKTYRVLPQGFEKDQDFPIKRFRKGRTVIIIALVLLALIGYFGFQSRYAFIDPPLFIQTPKENQVITKSQAEVKGKTEPNSTVYVNNDAVSVSSEGDFTKTVDLFPGKVTINVKAVNKFQRVSQKKITVEVKPGS
jgi:cytoskeletal protein RodZ